MFKQASTSAAGFSFLKSAALAQSPSNTASSECFGNMAELRAAGIQTQYRQTNSSDSDPLNISITGGDGGRFNVSVTKYGDAFARANARVCQENGRIALCSLNGSFTAGPAVDRVGPFATVVRGQINNTSEITLTPNGNRITANLGGSIVLAPAGARR
jgi:hypothetical protein